MRPMQLLCLSDIHIGRQPARIPADVVEQCGGRPPGPALAWERAVDLAIERGVAAVLLAGDVVEQEDDFYEALRDLRHGVERLEASGIPVLGVTGNHDVRVLPRLAERVPGFRLLGAGGVWEEAFIEGGDGERLRVLGWSFPEPIVRTSPLAAGLPPRADTPTVGLLHCDRDQPGSAYAPVASAELAAAPVDAWLLGHIHKPDALVGARPMGYLGSLTGLDPGETGAHGPWLMTLAGDGHIAMEQIPLAPLRWAEVAVPVDELETAEGIHAAVTDALAALHAQLSALARRPDAVGCRLLFTGRTHLRGAIERALAADDPRRIPQARDATVYFVHDWRMNVLPAIDLEALARGSDPAALLAHKIVVLRGGDSGERRELLASARRRLDPLPARRPFHVLGADAPDEETLAATLESAALRALDELLAQHEAGQ